LQVLRKRYNVTKVMSGDLEPVTRSRKPSGRLRVQQLTVRFRGVRAAFYAGSCRYFCTGFRGHFFMSSAARPRRVLGGTDNALHYN
jgi:hypothetical protein